MTTCAVLSLQLLLVSSPSAGAHGCDRDRGENCLAYEEAEALLAYEIASLINGLQDSFGFCKRRALIWASIGQLLPLFPSFQIFVMENSQKKMYIRKTSSSFPISTRKTSLNGYAIT